jgi:hypothetical protein
MCFRFVLKRRSKFAASRRVLAKDFFYLLARTF